LPYLADLIISSHATSRRAWPDQAEIDSVAKVAAERHSKQHGQRLWRTWPGYGVDCAPKRDETGPTGTDNLSKQEKLKNETSTLRGVALASLLSWQPKPRQTVGRPYAAGIALSGCRYSHPPIDNLCFF